MSSCPVCNDPVSSFSLDCDVCGYTIAEESKRPSSRSPLSWKIYPCEGNLLDDVVFQEWVNDPSITIGERIIHHQVAVDMMILEREPPYEIDVVTGHDV